MSIPNNVNYRADFPIFTQKIHGNRLAYLDNAATTQKPQAVLEAMNHYYSTMNANIHRGVHTLSAHATEAYEKTRLQIRDFIHAASPQECIFVRGTTEAINLVAHSFGEAFIHAQDEIIISALEHHANIVPWQLLCQRKNARLRVIPMNAIGELDFEAFKKLCNPKIKLLALSHLSNSLGTLVPIKQFIDYAHTQNIPVLIDAAQSIAHQDIDVQALDCDFLAFSGHKLYGPMGIGVLYGKKKYLEAMPPYQGGGNMIRQVSFEKTTYHDLPYKFEAGTPAVADVIGLGAALTYLSTHPQTRNLYPVLLQALDTLPNLIRIGTSHTNIGVCSFVMPGIHPHDIATILDQHGIAIRAGHHCAMPVMEFFGVPATARVSLGLYNDEDDIAQFIAGLHEVRRIFRC
jgi:cysteine desulfurase/selenocysteine lyase